MISFLQVLPCSGDPSRLTNGQGLIDLDTYTLRKIFKRMDFDDLLNMADTNNRFRNLIARHFMLPRYRIHEKINRFDLTGNSHIDENEVLYNNYDAILKLLRNYGHLLTKLVHVQPELNDTRNIEISQSIGKYCADTLTEITLSSDEYSLLDTMDYTLTNVFRVNVVPFYRSEVPDEFALAPIFPNMKELIVTPNPKSLESVQKFYPHLEFLIRSTPHLQSVVLNSLPSSDLLKAIDDVKLEALQITLNRSDEVNELDHVYLDHVKTFTLVINVEESKLKIEWLPISFERLEEFHVIATYSSQLVINLIKTNKNLKSLAVPQNNLSVLDTFMQWSDLEVLIIQWSNQINLPETKRLLNQAAKLQELTFVVPYRSIGDEIFDTLPDEWQFVREDHSGTYLTFKKVEHL